MENIKNKLRVTHYPQIGSSAGGFSVEVKDEEQAFLMVNALADQHLWLFRKRVIQDYSNDIIVQMFDESIDDETGKPFGWVDYYNELSGMEWYEVEEYFESLKELERTL